MAKIRKIVNHLVSTEYAGEAEETLTESTADSSFCSLADEIPFDEEVVYTLCQVEEHYTREKNREALGEDHIICSREHIALLMTDKNEFTRYDHQVICPECEKHPEFTERLGMLLLLNMK